MTNFRDPKKSVVTYTIISMTPLLGGAVASEHLRASQIGTSILSAGGNAADATVAAIIAIHTLCPYHSDIGGGGFALIRTPSGEHESLDFRSQAPVSSPSRIQYEASLLAFDKRIGSNHDG